MMLTGLADTLRAAGLEVIEEPGWKQRGHGPMRDVLGVTCHHTANGGASGDEPSRAVVRDGRPGLDGPLAHLLLRKDGAFRVIAAGLCYHAGASRSTLMGNAHRIGIEAEAKGVPGTAADWPKIQMDAYARGCKALAEHYNFSVAQVLGHKETCSPAGRKSDPNFGMSAFRARVAAVDLSQPSKGNAVATTDADADRIWNSKNELLLKQSPAGALKTVLDRVDADNLQLQVRSGIEGALEDSDHPLTERLARLEAKLDRLLAPPAPPPA